LFSFSVEEEWTVVGTYASYMAPWLLVHFVTSPVSFLPVLYLRQKTNFSIAIVGNSLILIAVAILSYFHYDFIDVLIVMAVLNSILMILVLIWYFSLST